MATLKDIWDYPNNSGSGYVADTANWSGDESFGLDQRLDQLLDGTYKSWPNLDPVANLSATVDTVSELYSKFKNYVDSYDATENLTFYKLHRYPVILATKKLIDSETITLGNTNPTSALIRVSGTHEFEDGDLVTISGMNNSWAGIDDADYYASDVDNSAGELKLRVGAADGPYIRFKNLQNADISSSDLLDPFTLTFTSHPFSDGDLVDLSGFDNDYTIHNGTSAYVQNSTSTTLQLSSDSGGTNLLGFNQTGTLAEPSLTYSWGTSTPPTTSDKWIVDLTGYTARTDTNNQTITFSNSTSANQKVGINTGTYNLIPTGISDELYYVSTDATLGNSLTIATVLSNDNSGDDVDSTPPVDYEFFDQGSTHGVQISFNPTRPTDAVFVPSSNFTVGSDTFLTANQIYYLDNDSSDIPRSLFTDAAKTSQVDLSNLKHAHVNEIPIQAYSPLEIWNPFYADDGTTDLLTTAGYYGAVEVTGNVYDGQIYTTSPASGWTGSSQDYHSEISTGSTAVTVKSATLNTNTLTIPSSAGTLPTASSVVDSDKFNFDLDRSAGGGNSLPFRVYAYYDSGGGVYVESEFNNWIDGKTRAAINQPLIVSDGGSATSATKRYVIFIHSFTYTGDVTVGGVTKKNGYYEIFKFNELDTHSTTWSSAYPSDTDHGLSGWDGDSVGTVYSNGTYITPDFQTPETIAEDITDNIWFDQENNISSGKTEIILPKYTKYTFGQYTDGEGWETFVSGTPQWVGPRLYSAPSGTDINPLWGKLKTGTIVSYGGTDYVAIQQNTDQSNTHAFRWYDITGASWQIVTPPENEFIRFRLFELDDAAGTWDPDTVQYGSTVISLGATGYIGSLQAAFFPNYPFSTDGNETPATDWDFDTKYEVHWTEYNPQTVSLTSKSVFSTVDNTDDRIYGSSYVYDDTTSMTINAATTAATTGHLVENFTPADAGQIALEGLTNANTGSIALATSEANKYEIDTVSIKMPGNIVYSYKDSSNVTQYGAQVDSTGYWTIDGTSKTLYSSTGETAAQFTVGVDGSGYLNSITLTEEVDAEGRYANGDDIVIPIAALADEYVAPTPYAEDVWDTDDEWDSDAYNPLKVWPTHVAPVGAKITLTQPSSVTRSQNGTKYVRSSGVIKQQLEVTYPPMTYDDFREFEAVVEAARGQATPFYFNVIGLDTPGRTILLHRTDSDKDGGLSSPYSARLKNAVAVGDKTILVEGFPANQSNVFIKGEYFINDFGYANGNLSQVVNDNVDSNIYGEAKIRMPYGARVADVTGDRIYKNPSHIVVTLGDDDFEYNVGTDLLYRFTVRFDFDEWK